MDHKVKNHVMDFDTFVSKVLFEIVHTGGHSAIKEELYDHYLCLVEDLLAAGHAEYEAHQRAMLSLGNPQDIGKRLNNVWFPAFKYNVHWFVGTVINLTLIPFVFMSELTVFSFLAALSFLFSQIISSLSQGALVKYLVAYFKKSEIPFVRVCCAPQGSVRQVTYVERLTNRLAIGAGAVFVILLLLISVLSYYEAGSWDYHALVLGLLMPSMAYQVYLSYASKKTPILIVDRRGIWVQNGTLPVLPWRKIAKLSFGYKSDLEFYCTVVRTNKTSLQFKCLPMDQETITEIFQISSPAASSAASSAATPATSSAASSVPIASQMP